MLIVTQNIHSKIISFTILWIGYFLCVFSRCLFPFFTSQLILEMKINSLEIGNLFLHLSLGVGTALFSSQFIARYFSHKQLCFLALLLLGLSQISLIQLTDWFWFKKVIFILGFASGLFLPSSVAIINEIWSKNSFGKVFSIYSFAQSFAFLCSPAISNLSSTYLSFTYRKIVLLLGITTILFSFFFLLFAKNGNFLNKTFTFSYYKKLTTFPAFWWLLTSLALVTALNVGIYNMIGHFFSTQHITNGNTTVMISRVSGICLALLLGIFADRWDSKKIVYYGILLCGFITLGLGLLQNVSLKLLCFHLQAPLAVALTPLVHAIISSLVPKEYNTSFISLFSSIAFILGAGVLPQVLGACQHFHSYGLGFLLIGSLSVILGLYLKPSKLPEQILKEN